MGKRCAMSVKADHYNISPYNILYYCGLIVNDTVAKYCDPIPIEIEDKPQD